MSIRDPLADFYTRLRNAIQVGHENVEIPHSSLKESICQILLDEGFIKSFKVDEIKTSTNKVIRIKIAYRINGQAVISTVRQRSKQSYRIYVKKSQVPKVLSGFGICILSTSKGILSGRDARLNNVGGELLVEVT